MSQFTPHSRAKKRDTDTDSVKGSDKIPKGNPTESEFARSAARTAYERGEERERERNDTERLGRGRRKDRTGMTQDTPEHSPAPGRERRKREKSPSAASVKDDAETGRGEKRGHHNFFTFGKRNKDNERDDASMAEAATNASERPAKEGDSHVKADKNIQKDRGTSPGAPRSEKLSGDGVKRTHPVERDAGHRRRKEGKVPEYEDELRYRGGEGGHDSTRAPPRAAGEGDKMGRHETKEQGKEREDAKKRDRARERERNRHQDRRNGPEQHRPGTRGTLLQRFFDPEELDDDKPCEGCGKAQPHCKTCQQGLPRRHVLRRVLGREIDQTEEGLVEGPQCEECEQPIPLCEICGLPSDVLRERGQARARKEKLA
ncbi:hypothetical protein ACEPAI_8670 [Sanghuangporus weigelae]